jgi:ribonuclease J
MPMDMPCLTITYQDFGEGQEVVLKTLESSTVEERGDWGVMQEKIRTDLKRYLNKQTQRRSLIMPVILEV